MKKPILVLLFVLMISTCLALPRTKYKQVSIKKNEEISVTETEYTTEAATVISSETTTENVTAEIPVITSQAPADTKIRSYTYEPVEIVPDASPADTLVINGVSINIGDNISDIISRFGNPTNTIYVPIEYPDESEDSAAEPVTNIEDETETTTEKPLAKADENAYGYDGFTIYTDDGKFIEKVEITDPSVETGKGVRPIGAFVFSLADSYGGPVSVEGDIYKFAAGPNAYMYFDAPSGVVRSWGIINK